MPELPEVENLRRCLDPLLTGSLLTHVEVRHARLARRNGSPSEVEDRMRGRIVERVRRRGKFIFSDLDDGQVWVTHLGMSGRIRAYPRTQGSEGASRPLTTPGWEEPHTHVVVRTDRGDEIRMVDPRTFGFVAVFDHQELAASPLARLGPDALTELPRSPWLAAGLVGRAVPIKVRLLDQTFIAGLGNIYADEVLHRARIRPMRGAGALSIAEVRRLRAAIRPVLASGIRWGGTTLDDLAYLLPDGASGQYLTRLRVYGRQGLPCRRCGSPVERSIIGARSSYYCPSCQR